MYSVNKKEDRELLQELGESIQLFAQSKSTQVLDAAELIGQWYLELSHRIQNHDYTQEDIIRNRVDDFIEKAISKKL